MKKLACLSLSTLFTVGLLLGQTEITGKWLIEAPGTTGIDHVTMDLKATGDKLSGSITRSAYPDQKPVTIDGKINGDTIVFTVQSPDGRRTITFTGRVKGNEIFFRREVNGTNGGAGIYGMIGLETLTAKRAAK